jgi:hypothetical protein
MEEQQEWLLSINQENIEKILSRYKNYLLNHFITHHQVSMAILFVI